MVLYSWHFSICGIWFLVIITKTTIQLHVKNFVETDFNRNWAKWQNIRPFWTNLSQWSAFTTCSVESQGKFSHQKVFCSIFRENKKHIQDLKQKFRRFWCGQIGCESWWFQNIEKSWRPILFWFRTKLFSNVSFGTKAISCHKNT